MTKVALITDTHFGVRRSSKVLHDFMKDFYDNVFFPTLKERKIEKVFHLGDTFDVRKSIDYWTLHWAKENFFDPLNKENIDLHMLVGNHDIYYRNSLEINAPTLNLSDYSNVFIYDNPQYIWDCHKKILLLPWVCDSNYEQVNDLLSDEYDYCFGHLEISGFHANSNYICETGLNPNLFSNIKRVFSGHFHKKSTRHNITYLGNPYQMYWNDEGDIRGFHILDLETGELEFIQNPQSLFYTINIKESKLINYTPYKNKYIKVIYNSSDSVEKLNQVISGLEKAGAHDVKIITTHSTTTKEVDFEVENTVEIFQNYVESMPNNFNKKNVINILKCLYLEAQSI